MSKWSKLLGLPGPKDLGMSDSNDYMASRWLSRPRHCEGVSTWEDYDERIAKEFPVKNFLANTVPDFFLKKIWYPVFDWRVKIWWYWLKCHTMPKHMKHIINISQTHRLKSLHSRDQYTHGWIDFSHKVLLANFTILCEHFEAGKLHCPTETEIEELTPEEGQLQLIDARDTFHEVKKLYEWWTIDRKIELEAEEKALDDWCALNESSPDTAESAHAWQKLHEVEELTRVKETVMLVRLMYVRRKVYG